MTDQQTPPNSSLPTPASEKTLSRSAHPVRNTNKTRLMKASVRARKAFQLRIRGWGWPDISVELGYKNNAGAWLAAERWMKRLVQEPSEKVRKMELARLDELWRKAMECLDAEHPVLYKGEILKDPKTKKRLKNEMPVMAAIERLLGIMDRRAKLLGLDMPSKMALTDPTGEKAFDPLHVYVPDNGRDNGHDSSVPALLEKNP